MHRILLSARARLAGPATLLLVLALLLPAGCSRRGGSAAPDLAIFATGSIYGQLETCG
jgi:hypothetical protein